MLVKIAQLMEDSKGDQELYNALYLSFRKAAEKPFPKTELDMRINAREISLGKNEGKLTAVREYRLRTGLSLMEAKNAIEDYFLINKILFKGYEH